ncbi:putative membrane protein [Wickerhamomyces ciferrii]|uniref:Membrane protein n=1 Tax=Wickerhamomyces ciferrii (strain ATCC 14091 / BCRC 22168 / CBS 111 / JCM 3599 / NBRC 0793 / NRRL Y-1031 F-60-10) TaxID=1206466 RepID=K0KPA4_WICCF|nr:uncharacterized protein BN7_2766 [Wickerhamomyces ciferrii]CCH43219.1 putative membrane protein [Wickerhamomyces ciferrii]
MLIFKAITLLISLTLTKALNTGQCHKIMAPDEPGELSSINLTAIQDTSLLVFHITDIEYTNIPLYFNDAMDLMNTEDGFYLCTPDLQKDGHCPHIGEFVIRSENGGPREQIINKLIKKGEKLSYNVTDTGMYCIYTHQDRGSGQGVEYKIKQPYGNLSIVMGQELDFLNFLMQPITLIMLLIIGIKWWKNTKIGVKFNSIENTLIQITWCYYSFVFARALVLYQLNKYDWNNKSWFWNLMLMIVNFGNIFFQLSIYWFFYLWTESPQGQIVKTPSNPGFILKGLMCLQVIFSGFFALFPTREATNSNLLSSVGIFHWGEKIITVLIWISLVLDLSLTITNAFDSKTKRKFQYSRQLVISVPVFLIFTSIFIQFVTSFDTFARSLKKSQSNESVIVNALENSVHYSFIFGIVENLSYFIIPLITIGLYKIWKDDKLEDDYIPTSNEVELGDLDGNKTI